MQPKEKKNTDKQMLTQYSYSWLVKMADESAIFFIVLILLSAFFLFLVIYTIMFLPIQLMPLSFSNSIAAMQALLSIFDRAYFHMDFPACKISIFKHEL